MTKKFRKSKLKAFSLVEILLAMAVFSIVAVSLTGFAVDSLRFNQNAWYKAQAALSTQEIMSAIVQNKNDLWNTIVNNTNAGAKHLVFSNGSYSFASGASTQNGISLSFQISQVYRDSSQNIVQSGGTLDVGSRVVAITGTWIDSLGNTNSITTTNYLTNWNTINWIETSATDFNKGTGTNTYVDNVSGGEVRLQSVVYADWCNPTISSSSYDLPGQGIASTITAIPGNAFVGTGGNASGVSLANVLIDNNDPPNVTVPSTFDGYKTNQVFGDGTYAYLTTDTHTKEVLIVNISVTPYAETGYFDAPGNGNGAAIYVANNKGYMTVGSKFYIFDLSSKTGSRSQLGTVNLTNTGTKIAVNGNYAYVTNSGTSTQLQIIDISNSASPSVVGTASVTGQGGIDIFINSAATRAYLVTAFSSTQNEFFIIDITTKTGTHSTIGSYGTNGMDPKGLTVAPDNTGRTIIVGTGGSEQYQVVNINTESSPVRCGGLAVSSGVTGVASIVNAIGNTYSYIITGNSAAELMIIKGGPGGGNSQGQGYSSTGTFISDVLDTTVASPTYYALSWTSSIPLNTSMLIQVRTGVTSTLSGSWYGPDGTSSTYFTQTGGEYIPTSLQNQRYFQYKVSYTSDTISTPTLYDIKLNYQK